MQSNDPANKDNADHNVETRGTNHGDWREMRRQWRNERREARSRDPFRGLFWGLLLILIGVISLLSQMGWIPSGVLWEYLVIGVGAILIISGVARYWNGEYRYGSYGKFVAGSVLILVGTFAIMGFSQWLPLIPIAAGIAILLSLFLRREHLAGHR